MGQAELLIAGLLVAVAGLSALARYLSVPYPIVLVVVGALIGFVPGLPDVKLDPEVVLLVFLPPLLYGEAIFANFGDFRANLRALTLSAVGLVLATMCAVAWAAHALIPGLPWAAGGVAIGIALERGDEPDPARARPRGVAPGDLSRRGAQHPAQAYGVRLQQGEREGMLHPTTIPPQLRGGSWRSLAAHGGQ
jgi:hypothetical protein